MQAESYQIYLRFINPGNQAEKAPHHGSCNLDLPELLSRQGDPHAYGEALATQLFDDTETLAFFQSIKTAVETADLTLRVRLLVGPTAQELHALRWELLTDPDTKAPLATSDRILFSRFMASTDWRTVRLRPRAALRALVAVAAPSNHVVRGTVGLGMGFHQGTLGGTILFDQLAVWSLD